jgi:uncharacterized protein YndB with AHSA1/START domain
MAFHVERSITIDRPVEDVFAFVADCRNDPRWCSRVLSVEQVAGDGPGPGARYRAVHRPIRLRKPLDLAVEVLAVEPPHRMTLRERDDDGVFDVAYELRADGAGTRMTQYDQVDLTGVPGVLHPLARRTIGRHLDEQLTALKALLESRGD